MTTTFHTNGSMGKANIRPHNAVQRQYRIAWAWRRFGIVHGATTLWTFPGTQEEALEDFKHKMTDAISCRVVEEVK